MNWREASGPDAYHPPRHKKSLVYHPTLGMFEATPCYGMHEPFWVVRYCETEGKVIDALSRAGVYPHVDFKDTRWTEVPDAVTVTITI